jgi:hypothetical protein
VIERYGIILDELEDAKAHLRQAKRTAMAQPFMVGLETYVERLKFVLVFTGWLLIWVS